MLVPVLVGLHYVIQYTMQYDYLPLYLHQALSLVSHNTHYQSNDTLINECTIKLDMPRYHDTELLGDAPRILLSKHSNLKVFILAYKSEYMRTIRYFVTNKLRVDDYGTSPLLFICTHYFGDNNKFIRMLQYIIKCDDVNYVCSVSGYTPLMKVCENTVSIEAIQCILNKSTTSINTVNKYTGKTALMYACANCRVGLSLDRRENVVSGIYITITNIIQLLIDTVLKRDGEQAVVEFISHRDSLGNTALFYASFSVQAQCLVENMAKYSDAIAFIKIRNNHGKTAIDVVNYDTRKYIIYYLRGNY